MRKTYSIMEHVDMEYKCTAHGEIDRDRDKRSHTNTIIERETLECCKTGRISEYNINFGKSSICLRSIGWQNQLVKLLNEKCVEIYCFMCVYRNEIARIQVKKQKQYKRTIHANGKELNFKNLKTREKKRRATHVKNDRQTDRVTPNFGMVFCSE